MMKMRVVSNPVRAQWEHLVRRPMQDMARLRGDVEPIVEAVRTGGDAALCELSRRFDHCELHHVQITPEESEAGIGKLPLQLRQAIERAHANISRFHAAQRTPDVRLETQTGVLCEQRSVPIQRVGIYVPGGSAPLFSTVLMLAEPARLAGCRERVLCTPPGKDGEVNPAILYAAKLCGITRLFRVGGAQAIAAMAYGTETIPKVDKIFGPGNRYVTAAKQIVSLDGVAIDMPAGPSEVEVYADGSCNPAFVAADLLSQAEHGPDSQVVLVTTEEEVLRYVLQELEKQLPLLGRKDIAACALEHSLAVLVRSEQEALDFTNEYAPEHLILAVKNARAVAQKVVHAGSVFIGNYSCESAGDYASGTNHTLPTMGCTKGYSSLGLHSFMRKMTIQELTAEGLGHIGPTIEIMAAAEGLDAHKKAVSMRLDACDKQLSAARTDDMPATLRALVRPDLLALKPYSSARDEAAGLPAEVCLDANEAPYNEPLNRYPDPLQRELKQSIANRLGVAAESIFLGNGSDEAIDLVIRIFCEPRVDRVVAPDPTYGMYAVCARINQADYTAVPLRDNFDFRAEDLLAATDARTKVIFLCSPNNPTGNLLPKEEVLELLRRFPGMVVVDEAYIDFAEDEGMLPVLKEYPRLIVLRTFSKAWASAGVRLGMALAHPSVVACLNKVKYPYNLNRLTAAYALELLSRADSVRQQVASILSERERVAAELSKLSLCQRVYPSRANFLLVQVSDAQRIYAELASHGIIVRNRSSALLCQNCLRITIGSPQQNDALLMALRELDSPSS